MEIENSDEERDEDKPPIDCRSKESKLDCMGFLQSLEVCERGDVNPIMEDHEKE